MQYFRSASCLRAVSFIATATLFLVLCVTDADGQVTRADSAAQTLEKVVVKTSLNPAVAGGASVVVVDPSALNLPPTPALADVLRRTPFVLVRQNSRGEIELSMRGSESRQMAIMIDGMPLSLGWDHRSDPSLTPITGVQSVKLVRGLSSLVHGPNMLGGTLELGLGSSAMGQTRERELMFATGADADGALGANVVAGRSFARAGGGSLSIRAGGGYRDRDGVPLSGDVTDQYSPDDLRTNSAMNQKDVFASVRLTGAGGGYIGLTGTGYQTERGVAPELHIDGPRFWKYPNQARTLGLLSLGTPVISTPFGHGRFEASAGYTRGTVHIEAYEDETYSTIDTEERGDERLTNAHLLLTHSFLFNGNLKAAFTGGKVQYVETLEAGVSEFEQRLWSSAVEVEIPVTSSLLFSGGVVNDASTTPETSGREALPRRGAWGWRAGASLSAMGERARIHASLSQRSRFPALRELYSGALNRFEPNPDLQPETLMGMEVGLSMIASENAARSLSFQAVVFHHNLEDAVVRANFPGTNRFIRVNRDNVKSTGIELFGSLVPSETGVSLSADLLIQNIKVEDQIASVPRQLEHQAEFKARAEVGVPLPLKTQGFASVRHTGKIYCLHPDNSDLVELKAQSAFDASLGRIFKLRSNGLLGSLKAVFGIDNVTDAAVFDACGLPQPGRSLRLGFQLF